VTRDDHRHLTLEQIDLIPEEVKVAAVPAFALAAGENAKEVEPAKEALREVLLVVVAEDGSLYQLGSGPARPIQRDPQHVEGLALVVALLGRGYEQPVVLQA
jgi:hypothetical protein